MSEFKLCSDGEFMPVSLPCPPPYSGPYYYYPYENIPLPPEQGITNFPVSSSKQISSGAVAGIIVIGGFIFFMMCLFALKCRTRFILGNIIRVSSRNARNDELSGDQFLVTNGDNMIVNIVGCGLEEKLVNLLPVCEYVGLMKEGKVDGKEKHECAVCLSLFEEKEIVRVLPKCHHIFHLQCIDKWFESHANCPLCRERITLQTIQLSFNPDKHDHDHLQPLALPTHHHLNDQHAVNSAAYVQNLNNLQDGRLPCDLQEPDPPQNTLLAAASATGIINPHAAEPAAHQPVRHHAAAGAHPIDKDRKRKAAGFTCSFEGLCHQNTIPITLAATDQESMKYKHNGEAAFRDEYCIYIGDGQSAGPVFGLQTPYDHQNPAAESDQSRGTADDDRTARSQRETNKKSYFVSPNKSQEDHAGNIDDQKTAGTFHNSAYPLVLSMISSPYPGSRPFSLLRKSLSTGSLIETDAEASAHAFHGSTRTREVL